MLLDKHRCSVKWRIDTNPQTLLQVVTFPDVYSKQNFSGVFLATVLTHCDGLLPVASYPVLQTQTSPQLIREFTVSSRGGHPVPLFCTAFPPSLTVSVHSFSPGLNNSAQAAYTAQVLNGLVWNVVHIQYVPFRMNWNRFGENVQCFLLWLNTYTTKLMAYEP